MKHCIKCGVELSDLNWASYRKKNWINKCDDCVRHEKKIQARKRDPKTLNERSKKHILKLRTESPIKAKARLLYSSAQKRAKKHGLDFDLTTSFIFSISPFLCPIMKEPLLYREYSKHKYTASLDRIDSSKGYTTDNVQIISYISNLMKSNATNDELIKFGNYYSNLREDQR